MLELERFTQAYIDCGGTLFEVKSKGDTLKDYLVMFRGLAAAPAEQEKKEGDAPGQMLGNAGDIVMFADTTAGRSYYYRGTGASIGRFSFKDPKAIVSFDQTDWQWLINNFAEGAQGELDAENEPTTEAPEGTPGAEAEREPFDPEKAVDPEDELAVAEETGWLEGEMDRLSSVVSESEPYSSKKDETGRIKAMFRQLVGLNQDTPLSRAARDLCPDCTPQEKLDAAKEVASNISRLGEVTLKIKNSDALSQEEEDFLQKCLVLRGTGKKRGIYLRPSDPMGGPKCGGEMAALGASYSDTDRYGVKIGTDKNPVWMVADALNKREGQDGKPLIPHPVVDNASNNAWNAIYGVMNEHLAIMAQCLYVTLPKDEKEGKKCFQAAAKEMLESVKLSGKGRLFIAIANAKSGGLLDQFESATEFEEGSSQLLDDLAEEIGEGIPDAETAVKFLMAKGLQNWQDMVSALPDCVKLLPAGQAKVGIDDMTGEVTNSDLRGDCGGASVGAVFSKYRTNEEFDVTDGREPQDNTLPISVKEDAGGGWIGLGKRGLTKLRNLSNVGVNLARARQAEYIDGVCSKAPSPKGCPLPAGWKDDAQEFREKEVNTVNAHTAAIRELGPGMTKEAMKVQLGEMGYDSFIENEEFVNQLIEFASNPDDKSLEHTVLARMTQGFRNAHKNEKGFRGHIALDTAITGMSTERQLMAFTGPQGTQMGLESDVIGTALGGILGIGVDKPFEVHCTQSATVFKDTDGMAVVELEVRPKDGLASQLCKINKKYAQGRLKPPEKAKKKGNKKNESLSVEDLIRKLQELL